MLPEEVIEEIYQESKAITENVSWYLVGGNRYRLLAKVFRPNGEELILYGTKASKHFSFTLRYRGKQLVRRWDFAKHNNPDGTKIPEGTPHKHKFTEEHNEEEAYVVEDVPMDDINKAFLAFLRECNIVLEAGYIPQLFPR